MTNLTQNEQTVLTAIDKVSPATRKKILDESTKNLPDVSDEKLHEMALYKLVDQGLVEAIGDFEVLMQDKIYILTEKGKSTLAQLS